VADKEVELFDLRAGFGDIHLREGYGGEQQNSQQN
jgi:hypothetical protein